MDGSHQAQCRDGMGSDSGAFRVPLATDSCQVGTVEGERWVGRYSHLKAGLTEFPDASMWLKREESKTIPGF